jgi:RNA polymerase sigma-70 factor (ECF subfamily)
MREAVVTGADGWATVYEANADRLMKLATFLAGPHAAVDLVQESVARAVRSPRWTGVADQGAYLTRVLVNEARRGAGSDARRRAREERVAARSVPESVPAYGVDADVRDAVRDLSAQQRAIVFLTYWEDLSIPVVAERLGVGEGTVRRQLARAKSRLRKVLNA